MVHDPVEPSVEMTPARVARDTCAGGRNAIVLPVGPGRIDNALDTIDSILHFIDPNDTLFVIDDFTEDGTYERLAEVRHEQLRLIRNERHFGYPGLPATVAHAIRHCVSHGRFAVILKIDSDALVTGPNYFTEVAQFLDANRHVGICGRHLINYDGSSKTFRMLTADVLQKIGYPPLDDRGRGGIGWICRRALINGWGLGENIFGGAYFIRYECAEAMVESGFFDQVDNPANWLAEDVFVTMCALATGFDRAHFAAPIAPFALAFRDLPAPPAELAARGIKIIHSVDKGRWTSAEDNGGVSAREFFRQQRRGIA